MIIYLYAKEGGRQWLLKSGDLILNNIAALTIPNTHSDRKQNHHPSPVRAES